MIKTNRYYKLQKLYPHANLSDIQAVADGYESEDILKATNN
jgi:hypothetical protein